MPWPSAVQTVNMTENAHIPDSDRIRREALQRSWQRDKEVGARRLRFRWAVWALCRYGLPLLIVLGTAVAVWIWGLPQLRTTLTTWTGSVVPPTGIGNPANVLPVTPTPNELPAALPQVAEPAFGDPAPTPSDQGDGDREPIQLLPEDGLSSSSSGAQDLTSPDGTDSTTTLNPVLRPDIGTHSKEP